MIQPLQIRLVSSRAHGGSHIERIEIATGPFLGHEAGTMSLAVDARGQVIENTYAVAGQHYAGMEAALNACMAAAYGYVAAETSAEAEA